MPRYLVQSVDSGQFLVPDPEGGEPIWVPSLREAGGGVLADHDEAIRMGLEYIEQGEAVQVVDLDRLGTANDY